MAKERLNLEPEVQEILALIDENNNFLLSGGAGSGKTYSLVQLIEQLLDESPQSSIACITYTNAAVREIENRIKHPKLTVGTIHDFLWDNIKSFQGELREALIESIGSEEPDSIKFSGEPLDDTALRSKRVQYKEYTLIREGVISHDEVLVLARDLFRRYKKLGDIVKDRYNFILVDEYQDTSPLVVESFLNGMAQGAKYNCLGFFGDSMQSIYDEGVGDLKGYVDEGRVLEVKKEQNRRNPRLVYELANKLRTDGIVQVCSSDLHAPNMLDGKVIDGEIKFIYTKERECLDEIKSGLGWDFSNTKENKELNLTHNLIAPKAGFPSLMKIYDGDKILEYKARVVNFIKANEIDFSDFDGMNFEDVVKLLKERYPANVAAVSPTAGMQAFIDDYPDLYRLALSYPFEVFRKIYTSKDDLIDDKKDEPSDVGKVGGIRDDLIRHLFKIQRAAEAYNQEKYNEFLRLTEFKVKSVGDKEVLKGIVERLSGMHSDSIESVIEYSDSVGLCKIDDRLSDFIKENSYTYGRVKDVAYGEFVCLYSYLEGHTPFSTQHKIKGAQFDNVLVVLDNGKWNKYNFEGLFTGGGNPNVVARTRKLFYVCCTRAKRKLVVYYHGPGQAVIDQASKWFGAENVKEWGG